MPHVDTLPDWLAHRAASTPTRAALIAGPRTWSFAELDAEATRVARRLARLGVRKGDCVATLLANSPDAVALLHATPRLGATLVPLNVRLSAAELAWQLEDAAPKVLLVDGRSALLAEHARARRTSLIVADVDSVAGEMAHTRLDSVDEADGPLHFTHDANAVLAILYTSGTTGRPKGAMLTLANFWWSAVGSALNLGTRDDDRWLVCLPLFHVGGLSIVLRAAIYGITAVVHDGFDAAAVNRALDGGAVTIVSAVAVMLQRMLDERRDRPYPSSLRCVLLGGGPAPRSLLERCARSGVPVVQTYGLTETASQAVTLPPEDMFRKLGSAGLPLYPNAVRVVTASGDDARRDEPGEILVRGPVVMKGYAGQADATARAIVDGWLHTGDIGRIDADGYLYVLDRRDDLIITGGENVYPAEVEAALLEHPWVAEAAVIGVSDVTWGQRVVAVVRLAEGHEGDDGPPVQVLQAHCRARLAAFKTPREIRIATDLLPRTASGKLRRAALREQTGDAAVPPD